jgi:hypothetical protein
MPDIQQRTINGDRRRLMMMARMTWTAVTCAAMVALATGAWAEAPKSKQVERTPEESRLAQGAAEAAKYGESKSDPEALVTAARMMKDVKEPIASEPLDGKLKDLAAMKAAKGAGGPKQYTVAGLAAKAKPLAAGNEKMSMSLGNLEKDAGPGSENLICFWGYCYGVWGCWAYCY